MDLGYPGQVAGTFSSSPQGIILHGSRSARASNTTLQEYQGTASWARSNPASLGWNATIGDDQIALHLPHSEWGWNARAASSHYLAVEFAQPLESAPISDAQVRSFCWYVQRARLIWPELPDHWPTHAELDGNETGAFDGKSDVFGKGSFRTLELRLRIAARLAAT